MKTAYMEGLVETPSIDCCNFPGEGFNLSSELKDSIAENFFQKSLT